jgi:hypothetical protein
MMLMWLIRSLIALLLASLAGLAGWHVRRRNMHGWLGGYLFTSLRRGLSRRFTVSSKAADADRPVTHVLICIADHFEPSWGNPTDEVADARVAAWVEDYPRLLGSFRDSDGRAPRHTFFYPIDQYLPRHVDALAGLCRNGFGEVEIHLHHDNDTAENLARTLDHFTNTFAHRHGVLGRWPDGRVAYGFVHGNWALDNSLPDGRLCGVCNELEVLRQTGCYADFTLPSYPSPAQTRTINSLYYAAGRPGRCFSHNTGTPVGALPAPKNSLMIIQGPLGLCWPKGSRTPRIENGCIQKGQPPSMQRLAHWMHAAVQVPSRPDWFFVKLHTHGAKESNRAVLLGEEMQGFHRELANRAATDNRFHFHYVSAREMYNLAKAAEAGWEGPIAGALDYQIVAFRPDNMPNYPLGPRKNGCLPKVARNPTDKPWTPF